MADNFESIHMPEPPRQTLPGATELIMATTLGQVPKSLRPADELAAPDQGSVLRRVIKGVITAVSGNS